MITLENQTVYICEFCKKRFVRKKNAEKHEKYCSMNPQNHHACSDCKCMVVGEEDFVVKSAWGVFTRRKRKTFSCPFHKGKKMYSYKVEKYGHEDQFDLRMPIKCKKQRPIMLGEDVENNL